jgi:hypothetical protein
MNLLHDLSSKSKDKEEKRGTPCGVYAKCFIYQRTNQNQIRLFFNFRNKFLHKTNNG